MSRRDGAAQIRDAAEVLIAERGIDTPLRDIAKAARQRNNSAVQYHYGNRDSLIAAIVEHRNTALEAQRLELIAQADLTGDAGEVRTLVELIVRPMAEIPYAHGSTHYARFLLQVRNHPAVLGDAEHWSIESPAMRIILARLDRLLAPALPARLRAARLVGMASAMFALLADRERELTLGKLDEEAAEASTLNIIDVLVAMLTAEPSEPIRSAVIADDGSAHGQANHPLLI